MKKLSKKGKIIILCVIGLLLLITGVFLLPKGSNEKYTIRLNYENGTEVKEIIVESSGKIAKPDDPVKEGYVFEGWEYNGELFDFNQEIDENIILTARWKMIEAAEKYTVVFDLDNGSEKIKEEVDKGNRVERIEEPTKEGYTFKYWERNGIEYDFNQEVTSNMELKAIYELEEQSTIEEIFTVTFDSDGGSSVESQSTNTKAKKPTDPVKSGYVFIGWYLNGTEYNFNNKVTGNITLKAKWLKDEKFTITFDSAGGSSVASQTVNTYKTVSKPTNPTKSGYTFVEWQLNGKTYNFSTPVTGNITLKAVWDVVKYTVTFDSAGGSTVNKQNIEINKTATEPKKPTKTGYTFVEWRLNGNKYNFNTPVTGNITLKAEWTINTYTVQFDLNGGSGNIPNQTIEYGKKVTEPANPTKAGATFVEWRLNGNKYAFSTPVTGNITLKAQYKEKEYTFKVSLIDEYSPDRTITVYEDKSEISFSSIKVQGVELCKGSNPTVSKYDIEGVSSVTVILTNGDQVTAKLS